MRSKCFSSLNDVSRCNTAVTLSHHLRWEHHLCMTKKPKSENTLTLVWCTLTPAGMVCSGAGVDLTQGQRGRGAHSLSLYHHCSPPEPPGLESASECQRWRQSWFHNPVPVCQDYRKTQRKSEKDIQKTIIFFTVFLQEFMASVKKLMNSLQMDRGAPWPFSWERKLLNSQL